MARLSQGCTTWSQPADSFSAREVQTPLDQQLTQADLSLLLRIPLALCATPCHFVFKHYGQYSVPPEGTVELL